MNQKDLLSLLDLEAKPPDPVEGTPSIIGVCDASPATPASPTALQVDAWGLRRGRDMVAESDRLRQAGINEFAAADFFAAAFDPDPQRSSTMG